jgi:DNA-binding transcriptional LysR family regulator
VLVEEGDLAQLLPKLRLGEHDLFVGRLEPGYAAPDLETEPLYNEPMTVVVRPDHPLTRKARAGWRDLSSHPCVMPPPYASLRVKLDKLFLQHDVEPPADLIETASFLSILTFVRQRGAIGFLARSVSRHFEREGQVKVLPLQVPVELPPVGIITLRGRRPSPSSEQLIDCLRRAAQGSARQR